METEKAMNSEESLLFIQRMINTAKEDFKDDSFHYLLWGWLVFAACTINLVFIEFSFPMEWIGWAVLMPLGGIIGSIYGYKQGRKNRAQSYIHDIMKYVLIAFTVCLFVVLFFQFKLGLETYPLVMLIYGMLLFVSGGALKFRPLILGGIINWALAVASFFAQFEMQLVFLALAVLLGYIIPGYLLKRRYQKQKN